MLQNLSIISLALITSHLLVLARAGASCLQCNDNNTFVAKKLEYQAPFQCLAVPPVQYGEDYVRTVGIGAHKFHKNAQTWNDARKACVAEGAHLAIIDAEGEKELILDMYNKEFNAIVGTDRTDLIWLGAQDYFQESEFVTVLGEPLSTKYIQFNNRSCGIFGDQPDNGKNNKENGPQNCLSLVPGCQAMDDNWCHKKFAFFCEKSESC